MTIKEAYQQEKVASALVMHTYEYIEQFIRKWILNSDRYLELLKKQPTYFQYSRDGGSWTQAGAEEMMSYIKIKISAEDTQFDPLPTGGPDFSDAPNGPFATLEAFLLQPRGELQDYSGTLYEILKAVYENLRAMGKDFKDEQSECFALMFDVRSGDVDWNRVGDFSKLLVAISKANLQPVDIKATAIADDSTYREMFTLCTEGIKLKLINKQQAETALRIYQQGLSISKGIALRKIREYLRTI